MPRYRLPCGHVIADIPCATAFRSAADEGSNMKCPSAVRFSSPLCGHSVQLPCWATAGGPWETFRSPVVEKPPSMHQKEEDGQPIVLESVLASLSGEALPKDLFNEMRLCCDRHVKVIMQSRDCAPCRFPSPESQMKDS